MARQTLVWTCLPNGISDDEKNVRVSVMVSPKLDAAGDPQELASFPEWVNWPRTLNDAVFIFMVDGQPIAKTKITDNDDVIQHDPTLGAPDSDIWQAVFKKDFYVESYDVNRDVTELLESKVLSYSATDVHDFVKEMYVDLATRTNDDLPRIGRDLLGNNLWQELIQGVQQIDRWGNKPARADLLPDPRRFDNGKADMSTKIGRRFAALDALLKDENKLASGNGLARKVHHLARVELFHTPPLRPKAIKEVPRTDDPAISETVEEFEQPATPTQTELAQSMHFHRAVAAMNNYPTLLRHLGLVVDFNVRRELFEERDYIALEVAVEFENGLPTPLTNNSDTSPITYVTHKDNRFFSSPRPHLNPNNAILIHEGLLDIYRRPERYAILQTDIDSAALKLINFARTLGNYDLDRKADPAIVHDDVSRHEKKTGAPSLRTSGISLVRKERATALKSRFAANQRQKDDAQTQQGIQLWAEDIVRGYRVDIWDAHTRRWRSLCRRVANYELGSDGRIQISPRAGEEEATVQLAATRSPDPTYNRDVLYLHDSMVAWTGWSLAAPQPGKAVGNDIDKGPDGKPQFTEEAGTISGLDFKSTFNVVSGSLPRLRYGRRYALRARAVDLAGNSLLPRDENIGPEDPEREAQPFLRFESIAAPVLALAENAGEVAPPGYGESMYRLAIRSFNDQFDDPAESTERTNRIAVPPQSTVRDAELHGMLDDAGAVSATTFQMLAEEKDRDARDPNAALVERVFELKGPLDADNEKVPTTYSVWREGVALTYLPDPMAQVVSAWFFDHPGMTPQETLHIPLYPAGARWPHAEPFRIELYEDAANPLAKPFYDEQRHSLQIPLAKGERAKLRLSMRIRKRDLFERMGLWQWLDEPTQQKIEAATLDGRSWLFTPWQDVELVHAVQRPLLKPEIKLLVINRNFGATFASPRLLVECSLNTTDHLDLLAQWHEPLDPPANAHRGNQAFTVKITRPVDYQVSHFALREHSLPDEENAGPNIIGINRVRTDFEAHKHHEFGDTRYRRIEYHFKATSRYREYLPPELLLAPYPPAAGETAQPIDTHIAVDGETVIGWIPNSAPPPAPEILYVVPTFGWSRTQGDDGTRHSWRRGGGLRVYLDRPWNSTGYGEMLAVVLPASGFTINPETEPPAHPAKNFITQWGSDPLWTSPAVSSIAPRINNFPRARLAPDPTGAWLPPGAPTAEADQQPGNFNTRFFVHGINVDIAPHDVFFDEERQLWYCDIEIDHGNSYWPFVRLALARYQPSSVDNAHLSEIVLADFMQLTQDRWATLRHNRDRHIHEISLFGASYSDSAATREARSARSKSLIDPLTGTVTVVQPARFATGSVVEVWLERLDPALGADFGWQRIAEGHRNAVLNPDLIRRQDITNRRNTFDNLQFRAQRSAIFSAPVFNREFLDVNLIERWFKPQVLWEGRVATPADLTGDRYRIVIAEYEEYPVDGDLPYEDVPTTRGRRLVFVEHIELR